MQSTNSKYGSPSTADGTRKHAILPRSLKWLPVQFRIKYKLLLFVFKSLNGLAPKYLEALVSRYSSLRPLRSSHQFLLVVPRTRCKLKGDRAFSVATPLWNALPMHIISAQSISIVKGYLLSLAFNQLEFWTLIGVWCYKLCFLVFKLWFVSSLFFLSFFIMLVQHFWQPRL